MFQSTDAGSSWRAINTVPTAGNVRALAIDPQASSTLYAGTSRGGVFKSTDWGANWTAINTGLTNTTVFSLAIDAHTPGTLYAGTSGGGAFVLHQ